MTHDDERTSVAREFGRETDALETGPARSGEARLEDLGPEALRQLLRDARSRLAKAEFLSAELTRTQVDLVRSRNRYLDLYDQAPVGYCTLTAQGVVLEANSAVVALLGQPRHSLLGLSLSQFVIPEDHPLYDRHRAQLLETGASQSCELRLVSRDGAPRWARLELALAREPDGTPVCRVVLTATTERKLAEEALRKSSERLRFALGAAKAGTWELDLRTQENTWSKELWELLGIAPGSLPSTYEAWLLSLHPEDREAAGEAVRRAVEQGTTLELELRAMLPGGEVRWLLSRGQPERDDQGRILRYLGVAIDITERKRMEAANLELEARNQRLQKVESLGRMASAIAHHFNNKLQSVMMCLELALDCPTNSPRQEENLTDALRSASKAAEVSSLMLTYLGKSSFDRKPIDLSQVCRRCVSLLRAGMPPSVSLLADITEQESGVIGDAAKVQQVLTNLITNAWEARSDGPCVVRLSLKEVRAVEIPEEHRFPIAWKPSQESYACVEVADNGCGIPSDSIATLFDPFYTSKFLGRGLGLPVVLGIVQAHGGAVSVESEAGKGSVFRVWLPLIPEVVNSKRAGALPPRTLDWSGVVLVVDDEELVRRVLAAALQRWGFTVLTAQNGREAVEVFRSRGKEIRCVLCDLTMPHMDGWQTLMALRQLDSRVPVLLTSGYSEAEVMQGQTTERPAGFLHKPVRLTELREAMGGVLSAEGDDPCPTDRIPQR